MASVVVRYTALAADTQPRRFCLQADFGDKLPYSSNQAALGALLGIRDEPRIWENKLTSRTSYTALEKMLIMQHLIRNHLRDLNASQIKVLLFICDRTVQWGRRDERIPIRHFVEGSRRFRNVGTGLSASTVSRAIGQLMDKRLIERWPHEEDRGNASYIYNLDPRIVRHALNADLARYTRASNRERLQRREAVPPTE